LYLTLLLYFFLQQSNSYAQNVRVSTNRSTGFMEIKNGLAGIVIPGESAIKNRRYNLAPIQSFIYRDGAFSDNTENLLSSATEPQSLKITTRTKTADEVTVVLEYRFQKKKFEYGKQQYKGGEAGPGFYRCMISLKRGEKTILIEEETDYDITYSVKISNGLSPDKARYRGWQSTSVQGGYEPGGGLYRAENQRAYPLDATVDIDYAKAFTYQRLTLWEPHGGEVNTGRYWQVFNSRGNNNANLFGFFQGKPSRLLNAVTVGPALQVRPQDPDSKEKNDAEIFVSIIRRGPDNSWFTRKRFQWVAYISTRQDVLSPEKDQPIGNAMNRVSGLGQVVRNYADKPVKLVPAFYKGAIYMPAVNIAAVMKRVKTDNSFYNLLVSVDGGYKSIWDAWRFPDSARSQLRALLAMRERLVNQYTSGEGSYSFYYRYWMGARAYKQSALEASCLLADAGNNISTSDKKKLESLIGLMARIVWDNNNVPLFDSAGVNFGPANMVFQYRNNARTFFALLLAGDPEFSARVKNAASATNRDINDAIYASGASIGTPHYTQPTIEPILLSMLQLREAGVTDLFKSNKRIAKFARFYSSLLTPPSPRFANNHKLISIGDGSEESASTFAFLATGLKNVDPALSEQLLSIYHKGPARSSLAGPVALAADLGNVPEKKLPAATSHYPGYTSHYRSGVNTPDETAVWIVNGDSLYDHRMDDAGEATLYALQAPLSVAWSSFYYPHATDARIKSVVVPEKMFAQWKTPNQPIEERSLTNRTWTSSSPMQFARLGYSSTSSIRMRREGMDWYRNTTLIAVNRQAPVIIFYDSVTGNEPFIWSMNMLSDGAIITDAGPLTPVKKMNDNASRKELPEATPVRAVPAGLRKFGFTGQQWPAHPSKGIDWHLYTLARDPLQFTVSSWATAWQNGIEQNEFQKTNGRKYSEEQQIIRLRGIRPLFSVILPYKKGADPYRNRVKQLAGGEISIGNMVVAPGYFSVSGDLSIIGILSPNGVYNKNGWRVGGGYMEIEYNSRAVTVRVHGNSGKRTIDLPFAVQPAKKYSGVGGNGRSISIDYTNNSKALENGDQGYTEYSFRRL
jgi:hypothetical protein